MLVGSLAIALDLLSVALMAFFIGVLLMSLSIACKFSTLNHFTFRTRKFVLWLLATGPWWIAATCVAIFWPRLEGDGSASWISNFAHWQHEDLFAVNRWHSLTLLVSTLLLFWLLTVIAIQSWNKSIAMRQLLELSDRQELPNHNSNKVYTLHSNIPTAFTSGLLSPKVYLTSALQKQMADSAVTHLYDNLDVAQTLINVARLQQKLPSNCDGVQLSYFGNEQISQRVHTLVSPLEKTPMWALCITLVALVGAPLIAASTVDSFHHFIETIFTH